MDYIAPNMATSYSPEPENTVVLHDKRDFADVIEVINLKREISLD